MILKCPFCKKDLKCVEGFDPYNYTRDDNLDCVDCTSPILSFTAEPYLLSKAQALYDFHRDELMSVSIITEPDLFLITADYSRNKTNFSRYVKASEQTVIKSSISKNKDGFVVANLFDLDEIIDLWDKNISDKIKFLITYS